MLHTFSCPFCLVTGGEEREITYIELKEPSAAMAGEMASLSAYVGQLMRAARSFDVDEAAAVDAAAEEVPKERQMASLISFSGVNPSEAFNALKNILKKTDAKLNAEFKCAGLNYDNIPYKMLVELLGVYIANFFDLFN